MALSKVFIFCTSLEAVGWYLLAPSESIRWTNKSCSLPYIIVIKALRDTLDGRCKVYTKKSLSWEVKRILVTQWLTQAYWGILRA